MRVRPFEARDLAAWVEMRRALWPDENAGELAREAAKFSRSGKALGLAAVLVSENASGELTGFVEIGLRDYVDGCSSSPVPFIEGWYVAENARRTGVGRTLIAAAEAWSIERGHTELASDALLDNEASEVAHKALGFEEVERAIRFRKALRRPLAPVLRRCAAAARSSSSSRSRAFRSATRRARTPRAPRRAARASSEGRRARSAAGDRP